MQPQIVTVHDIHAAIEDATVFPYMNTIVQDMNGNYSFVNTEAMSDQEVDVWEGGDIGTGAFICEKGDFWYVSKYEALPEYGIEEFFDDKPEIHWFKYQITPIPLKIAYFIIQALSLKAQMAQLSVPAFNEIKQEGKMAVYLTPGKELFGKKIEKLMEIPAELRPVVVERL